MSGRLGQRGYSLLASLFLGAGAAGCSFPDVTFATAPDASQSEPEAAGDDFGSTPSRTVESGDPLLPDSLAEAGPGDDVAWPSDALSGAGDGPADSPESAGADSGDGCVSDLNWCNTHCGTGLDNCNRMRPCASNCPTG